ncbi:MAG: ACT domain-containing protein [Candidatus Methanomethylophilaceae archaeon]|nr:ACT domain-containing protein [Candidatus Methanomethylophilaceae archaeon]
MTLKVINEEFTICKLKNFSQIDIREPFVFTGSTDEEKSLVCPTRLVPSEVIERSDGWKAFRIEGVLDFSLIGIIAKISAILADNGIGIFVVSTFNTDYILTQSDRFEMALRLLSDAGYCICS